MKKILFSLVVLSLLIGGFSVLAQDNTLPSPGLTPDSPFYFLKVWKEQIQLFFTFGAENKTKQYLHLSDIRLAEYQKMIEKGKTEIAQKTLDKYEKQLNRAIEITEELKNKGKDVKDISQRLEDTVGKHIAVLEQNLQKVPESGKKGIENAIEKSSKVLEKFKEKEITCVNKCGDGKCDEVVCIAVGCPCPETKENCPQDCKEEIVKPTCQDECSQVGLKRCYNVGNYGYQTCGDYDSDDCLEWSSTTICPPDTITCQNGICIQQGQKEQKCSDGTLFNQCSTNKPSYCENGNLINKCSTCGCPSGKQCQSNGGCTVSTQTTCQDECSPVGSKRCSDNGYQVCGNYDTDECLEWGSTTNCPVNTICQNGNCVVQQKCSDGTLYGQCSTEKPKYCDNGNLVDKASICRCPSGYEVIGDVCTLIKTCNSDFDCQNTSIEFKCENNQCTRIRCITNQECWDISNSLTCENNFCVGHSCNSIGDCFDLNPLTKNFCNETTHRCSNKIVPCVSGDNFCPLNCNDWELDNDCGGVPKIWDMIASNEPEDYLGDTAYTIKSSDWKHYQPMIDKVNELTQGLTDNYDKAKSIANWVKNSRPYLSGGVSVANQQGSVIEIFNENSGVCLDSAILLTAMLRLAGIPARSVQPGFGIGHQITEAYINNKWIGIDATFGSGNAYFVDDLTSITYTGDYIYGYQNILETPEDTISSVSLYKFRVTPKSSPTEYGYVLFPTTDIKIFYPPDRLEFSPTFTGDNRQVAAFGCGLLPGNFRCDYYTCTKTDTVNYQSMFSPGFYYTGYSEWHNRFFGGEITKNGYKRVAYPSGNWRFTCGIGQFDIGYKDITIIPGSEIRITPDSLIKYPDANSTYFNMLIQQLTKSTKGL